MSNAKMKQKWSAKTVLFFSLTVVAFMASAYALFEMAVLAGWPLWIAGGLPAMIDGAIVLTILEMVDIRRKGGKPGFALLVFIICSLASTLLNGYHSYITEVDGGLPTDVRVMIGVLPPVLLLMLTKLFEGSIERDAAAEVVTESAAPADPVQPVHEPVAASEPLPSEPLEPVSAHDPVHDLGPVNQAVGHVDRAEALAAEPGMDDEPQHQPLAFEQPAQELPQTELALSDGVELDDPAERTVSTSISEPVASASVQVATAAIQPVRAASELSTEERAAVVAQARELISDGLSMRAASEEVGIPRATLSRWCKAVEDADQIDEPLARITSLHAVND